MSHTRTQALRASNISALLLVLAYLGFVSLGLPDTLLGVGWPSIRDSFGLPQGALGAILVAGGTGYFLSSFGAGALVRRLGVGMLLALSTALVTMALFGYSLTSWWPLFLLCATLAGLGSGAIDAGLNTHAAHHFSARHMNWLHACWGLGATLGPLLMTAVLARGHLWRTGYALVGAGLLVMTAAFMLTRHWWQGSSENSPAPVSLSVAIRQPLVWRQVLLFFLYSGTEAAAGQWAFTLLSEGRGLSLTAAGTWVGLYWGSLTVGRVLFGTVVERIGTVRLLRLSLMGAVVGAVLLAARLGPVVSPAGLMILGMALAPIFPCLMSETPRRVGEGSAAHAVGFQVSAAVIGIAVLPSLAGLVAERSSLEMIGVIVVGLTIALLVVHEQLLRALPVEAREG